MTTLDPVAYLAELVHRLAQERRGSFAGVGLLLYRDASDLPVVPLRARQPAELPLREPNEIVTALLRYAECSNPYHDGFHLLSGEGYLTHVSQYFAPPIVRSLGVESGDSRHGGRHRAALYGSCLPNVLAAGVLSRHYGAALFVAGEELLIEMPAGS